jgi:putative membrane protein
VSRPALHALLNGSAAILLSLGWMAILGRGLFAARGRDETLHSRLMLAAVVLSTAFLASYLDYHAEVGHVAFWGEGALAVVYGLVLWPHVVLAALMVPPILVLLVAALSGKLERHKRLARITLPVWLYVSVTGVVVYVMNHAMRPA